jgi:hypothetical protein
MLKTKTPRKAKTRLPVNTGRLTELRRDARKRVRDFLVIEAASRMAAERCTQILHVPICRYEATLRQLKIHRKAGKITYEYISATGGALSSLRRLDRHAARGGYQWNKAWAELSPAARTAIVSALPAGFPLPLGKAPDPNLIRPFIPVAMQRARLPQTTTLERDKAVIAILRTYMKVYQKKPPSPTGPRSKTIMFITEIENAYRDLLPEGFGVSRSKATLDRLIKRAWPLNP